MVHQAIEVKTLDSLSLGHVDVIKIDVEGAELLAVEGAMRTIERDRPIILSEILPSQLQRVSRCSPRQYLEYFISRGYDAYIVDNVRCGEKITDFPMSWHKSLVNIGFLPREAHLDLTIFKTT